MCNVLYHTACLNILIIAIFIILKKLKTSYSCLNNSCWYLHSANSNNLCLKLESWDIKPLINFSFAFIIQFLEINLPHQRDINSYNFRFSYSNNLLALIAINFIFKLYIKTILIYKWISKFWTKDLFLCINSSNMRWPL